MEQSTSLRTVLAREIKISSTKFFDKCPQYLHNTDRNRKSFVKLSLFFYNFWVKPSPGYTTHCLDYLTRLKTLRSDIRSRKIYYLTRKEALQYVVTMHKLNFLTLSTLQCSTPTIYNEPPDPGETSSSLHSEFVQTIADWMIFGILTGIIFSSLCRCTRGCRLRSPQRSPRLRPPPPRPQAAGGWAAGGLCRWSPPPLMLSPLLRDPPGPWEQGRSHHHRPGESIGEFSSKRWEEDSRNYSFFQLFSAQNAILSISTRSPMSL